MTINIKYNAYFRTACIALFSLIFTGCTKDKLEEFSPGNATGKMVMVSLNVSLPPAVEPTSVSRYAVTKPFFRNRTNADIVMQGKYYSIVAVSYTHLDVYKRQFVALS